MSKPRKRYRYTITGMSDNLSAVTRRSLEDADYLIDKWMGKYATWHLYNRVTGEESWFTGELVGPVDEAEVGPA